MILGAGPFQVPAIRKAVALGCHVITVDYLPDNIGHQYSHEYVNCSTIDRDGVLQAAIQKKIDGICTFGSDVAVPSVAHVCEQLGLPGAGVAAAETMAYKHLFRAFLKQNRLPCPEFVVASSVEEVWANVERLKFPIMIKPVDTSGSRGVSRVVFNDTTSIDNLFASAQSFSHSRTVCLEEFVDGIEVGGDGFLRNGRFCFLAITQKYLNGFVVTGHRIPTNISTFDQERVRHAIEGCCRALGYVDGPLNFDVVVASDQIVILEMSVRNGGNGIPAVISRATGVDVEILTIQYAIGACAESTRHVTIHGAGSWIFGAEVSGMLKRIRCFEDILPEVPELFDLFIAVPPYGNVQPLTHNGNLVGYALFNCKSAAAYSETVEKIRQCLHMEVVA